MTLAERLQEGEARLGLGPHADRARRDAETLLLNVLGSGRAWLIAHWNEPLGENESENYLAYVDRRAAGEPIQYIVGKQEFYGLPFRVTRDVLIPRPETEHLVEKVLEWAGHIAAPRIVDVGTGSGAVAVALAHHMPQATVTATDISAAARTIAEENARRNGVEIRFLLGSLLEPVSGERFDVVVSNPPYVPESDRDSLSVEVRDYEPGLALFAGKDGLGVYRRLIPAAFTALETGGLCALEIGYGQSQAVGDLLVNAGFRNVDFLPDLQGIPRVAWGLKPR